MANQRLTKTGVLGLTLVLMSSAVHSANAASSCPGDDNRNGVVTVDEILLSVGAALNGCSGHGQYLLRTGQTKCDQGSNTLGTCPGSPAGQDGTVQAGAAPTYTDNGDGTIRDNFTGLVWEKLSNDGSIHDMDTAYTWRNAFNVKIATLNNRCEKSGTVTCSSDADCASVGGACGFAGHRDWRLPNRRELESIVNVGQIAGLNPMADPAFDKDCTASCKVTECSCTALENYWTSTTDPTFTDSAFSVDFNTGYVNGFGKSLPAARARAVRGG